MRKVVSILVLILLTGTVSLVNAQDIIMKKSDGGEVRAKVLEVGATDIKYKLYDNLSGPTYTLLKTQVFKITYQNGTVEMYNTDTEPIQTATTPASNYGGRTTQSQNYGLSRNREISGNYKKGYAGVGFSGAFLLQEYSDAGAGIQFNVNAGYLIGKHIGVTASFLLTSFGIEDSDSSVGLRGGLVGPLISFSNSTKKIEYDIRPTFGLVSGKVNVSNASVTTDDSVFALGVGATFRWNVSDLISLTGNIDSYFHGEFEDSSDLDLSSIGMGVGVNFRF
ncbi:MAG: porin family protein [Prevotellaceae bacterium]|jgi:hypothetical protein|nr:porin family protein [Prevotellaceae bacterium]